MANQIGSFKGPLKAQLEKIKQAQVNAEWVGSQPQALTKENLERFIKGEITWAQANGLTMEQVYSFAEFGYNLFEQGRYEDARKIFEGLIVLNPYDGYFHSVLGSIFARQGLDQAALKEYTTSLELDPNNAQVHVNRAELYLKSGQFEEAMTDLKQAVSVDPIGHNVPAIARARALAAATAALIQDVLNAKKGSPKK